MLVFIWRGRTLRGRGPKNQKRPDEVARWELHGCEAGAMPAIATHEHRQHVHISPRLCAPGPVVYRVHHVFAVARSPSPPFSPRRRCCCDGRFLLVPAQGRAPPPRPGAGDATLRSLTGCRRHSPSAERRSGDGSAGQTRAVPTRVCVVDGQIERADLPNVNLRGRTPAISGANRTCMHIWERWEGVRLRGL